MSRSLENMALQEEGCPSQPEKEEREKREGGREGGENEREREREVMWE